MRAWLQPQWASQVSAWRQRAWAFHWQGFSNRPPLSVTFRRCTVDGATGQGGFSIGAMEPGAAMGGYGVVIEGSLVTNTTAAGLSVFDKAAHGPPVVVRDTSFVHAGPSKL